MVRQMKLILKLKYSKKENKKNGEMIGIIVCGLAYTNTRRQQQNNDDQTMRSDTT